MTTERRRVSTFPTRSRPIDQIAALPYRRDEDGLTRILLITSRETGRWVVPKGNPMKGFAPHEAAAQEAYEEAGLSGVADPAPIGGFRYLKRRRTGRPQQMSVTVYPMAVTAQATDWPERAQRATRWFTPDEASAAVDEPDLKRLIAPSGPADRDRFQDWWSRGGSNP